MGTKFILVEPSHPGNVGGVARAIYVMGFSELRIVNPRYPQVICSEEAGQMAGHGQGVLDKAKVFDSLTHALEGVTTALATVMVTRDFGPETYSPREILPMLAKMVAPDRVAFVFGSERFGLSNQDVYACHYSLRIPTYPKDLSLNLVSAVQVIAYEWRLAQSMVTTPTLQNAHLADIKQLAELMDHWNEVLGKIGFFNPTNPKKLKARLQQMTYRAKLTVKEVDILRGIANQILMTKNK